MSTCRAFVRGTRRCIANAEAGEEKCSAHLSAAGRSRCPKCKAWRREGAGASCVCGHYEPLEPLPPELAKMLTEPIQ